MNSPTALPISPRQSALLVIDVQASFTQRPYFSTNGLDDYLMAQNALIDAARAAKLPIVRVFHTSAVERADDAFSPTSGWVRPLDGLRDFAADHTVVKQRHSALVGTGLDVWLTQRGIGEVVISGIRTEQCCETTARHASDLGWKVTFVPEATMTWPMTTAQGKTLDVADLRERTCAVLDQRFARMASVATAFQTGA